MKKILAILLALAMLVPMSVIANAEEAEKKPFYLTNWSQFESDLSHVYYMPFFWSNPGSIAAGEMPYVSWGVGDMDALAEKLKETFDSYPEGARHINFCLVNDAFRGMAEDVCILDAGIPVVHMWLNAFLTKYKALGGKLDGLVIDLEYFNAGYYYIHSNFAVNDPLIYDKIAKNPVYQEKIRPKLVERGFKFYPNVTEHTPEIYSIHPNSGDQYATSRAIWDAVVFSYVNNCITEACSPVWDYYPDAIVSDYTTKDTKAWNKEMGESGGVSGRGGNTTTAGNSNNENFYSVRPAANYYRNNNGPVYNTPITCSKTVYEESPFTMMLYDAVLAKNSYLSADNGHMSWWIAHYLYSLKNEKSVSNTPYYAETLYHLGMLNPDIFLGYIIKSEVAAITGGDEEPYEIALQIVDDVLADLTRVVGYADRKPICVEPSFNHQFVLSGMYANGKNYWRLTPDTSKVSLENFKIEGSDPTFYVGGETITFPGGKIIDEAKVTAIGTCGYWIETPADAVPIMTRESDFYEKYPAYAENFEAFEVGTEYNYNNANPEACWEMKKQAGGTAVVQLDPANADNKVVAFKGTYNARNVNMPENVYAGDTYAKHQAWQISFTLPTDLPADAEITLLNSSGEKKVSKDGGFKVAGGKIYYSQGEEYVEFANLTLTAGTKYTVVRDMDFTNADAITCTYYVYGADGTQLAKAKNIAVAPITVPVYSISYGVKGVTGEAVLFDDYKLYQTSVATDFFVYNAKTGMELEDITQAQEGDAAYRLSWLNATNKEKSYTVMAAYYNGDTLVEEKAVNEIKMAPNADGVITAKVENKVEGQTIKLYLKDNNPPETEEDVTTDPGKTEEPKKNNDNMLLIVLIAVAAVVLVGTVLVIVIVTAKKKKNTPTAE